jgi:hypothetical protein
VVVGFVLVVLGSVVAIFPRHIVAIAPYWRVGMPERATPQSVHAARIGALLVLVAGVIVVLAST